MPDENDPVKCCKICDFYHIILYFFPDEFQKA